MNPNQISPDNNMDDEQKTAANQIISPESQAQSPAQLSPAANTPNAQPLVSQPNQTQVPNQIENTTNKSRSKVVVLAVVVFAVIIVSFVAFLLITSSSEDTAKDSQNSQSNISTIEAAETKADEFITINKNSAGSNISKEFITLATEMDKYAKYNELPNISSAERVKEAALIGGKIGLYSNIFDNGTIEKTNVVTVNNSDEQVVAYYKAENPSASFLKGPYEFTVYTSYIDGAWRIVDFQTKEL